MISLTRALTLVLAIAIWAANGICADWEADVPEIVALTAGAEHSQAQFTVEVLPPMLQARMRATTWKAGCPTPLEELRLVSVGFWDFHGVPRQGELIVNQTVAEEVRTVFRKLFEHGFLIERMEPVESFRGDDERSMEANNTSSFNCRDVTGSPGRFSNHSWGRAIDINPLTNPYVLHGKSLPPAGAAYLDRSKAYAGSILEKSFIVSLFQGLGWTWGGVWKDPDYQHFEKPDARRK